MLKPIRVFRTKKEAETVTGSLSTPSKMPGHGYGLPARACQTGQILAKTVPDSPCASCYACKGRYNFGNVQSAQQFRLAMITSPEWVDAMVFLIDKSGDEYFRWHDSGDIQSLDHLSKICQIAVRLPDVKFWLPTQEKHYLNEYKRVYGCFPENLTVRLSSPVIDKPLLKTAFLTSSIHKDQPASGYACPAPSQGNKCVSCRACWDPDVKNISYHHH